MKVIYNFFWFLYELFKHRNDSVGIKTTKEISDQRLSICKNCELINKKGLLVKLKGPRCGVCGCFLIYKVRFNVEECANKPPKWFKNGEFPLW